MARYCLLAFALVSRALADSGYKAPSQGNGAPQLSGYGAPTAPAYDPQPSYDASAYKQTGYEFQSKSTDLFNNNIQNLIKQFFPVIMSVYLAMIAVFWFLIPFYDKLVNAFFPRPNGAREASGFFSTPETLEALTNFAHKAFECKLQN